MEQTYTSIILKKRDVGEMDRLYWLYTKERGKMQVLAKSVRKHGAKLAGLLENFTLADVTIARSRGTGKITGSIVENNFSYLKRDGEALDSVFSAINTINRFIDLENIDERLFGILYDYLETIDNISENVKEYSKKDMALRLVSAGFLLHMANVLGYTIESSRCAYCGNPISEKDVNFSARSGGIVCDGCVRKSIGSMHISKNAIKALRICAKNSLKSLVKLQMQQRDLRSLEAVINDFYRWLV